MINITKAKGMKELYDKGYSKAMIGRIYGVTGVRVAQLLKRLGEV